MDEVEVYRKGDRHRHPTEVEAACHEVEHGTMVNGEPLTRNEPACCSVDAKERFLCIIQASHIDTVELIVGIEVETAVDETKEEPRQHTEREATCRLDGNEDGKQYSYQ